MSWSFWNFSLINFLCLSYDISLQYLCVLHLFDSLFFFFDLFSARQWPKDEIFLFHFSIRSFLVVLIVKLMFTFSFFNIILVFICWFIYNFFNNKKMPQKCTMQMSLASLTTAKDVYRQNWMGLWRRVKLRKRDRVEIFYLWEDNSRYICSSPINLRFFVIYL